MDALKQLGYIHRGDKGVPGREAFLWPQGERRHHLYLCLEDGEALRDHLLFRDYLRAHPEVAEEYAALKQELSALHGPDRDAYSRGKSDFIERVSRNANSSE